ncbi:unnamed protein product [Cladocopium goreaui]|uniref:COP9 signalosome complex subunit 7b (SGN7b) (Signalosome subunit 7b) (JAB1-containing signalosome subunit 7b) n=1 Tax=Cladocopium goreaui TaxID=2562237 RepID=A0A9P1GTI0_9DINO|nr:unnamed protein product [Cladocopium goreaui]
MKQLNMVTLNQLPFPANHLAPGELRCENASHVDVATAALDVSARALEDLIIEAVYQNLVVGKMDQENECLVIESSACRDCRAEDLDFIIETLSAWQSTAQEMVQALDAAVLYASNSYEKQRVAQEELEKEVKSIRETLKEGDSTKAGGGGCTRMQTDDADEESKRAKSTRGRWVGAPQNR